MCNEWSGVNLSFFDEAQCFFAVATIDAAGLEGEVLAVHLGRWQLLGLVVKGYNGYNGVGACALPSEAEGVIGSGNFNHSVGSSMVAILQDKGLALLGRGEQYIGVVLAYKCPSLFALFADYDAFGAFVHHTKQGADACRACTDYKHGVFLGNLGYACCPKACGQYIAHKQGLFVGNVVWDVA